jgi:hypothetical protein
LLIFNFFIRKPKLVVLCLDWETIQSLDRLAGFWQGLSNSPTPLVCIFLSWNAEDLSAIKDLARRNAFTYGRNVEQTYTLAETDEFDMPIEV